MPYGLPDGNQLRTEIVEMCKNSASEATRVVKEVVPDCPDLREFARTLEGSEEASVDAFLQRQQNAEFRNAGRACIAFRMLDREQYVRNNFLNSSHLDWMRLLINRLRDGISDPRELRNNQVTVVTFNFDCLLEWRWRNALQYGLRLGGQELETACQTLEVIHVNGSLSAACAPESGGARGFGDPFSEAHVAQCYRDLLFFHDATVSTAAERAIAVITEADVVAFLGFSFHPMNLERVRFADVVGLRSDDDNMFKVYATGYGLLRHERSMAKERMRGAMTKDLCPIIFAPRVTDDSLRLLRQYPILDTGEPG